ncbi:phenylalanine--tRNA ligase subunit beta [bacterium]|nr:phenylalanine--tRNA ligase subunit beta [bacterium]
MLLSKNWLQKYVELPESVEELDALLTDVGLEVESIEDRRDAFKNIVVGEVLTCEKHPNADKLSVCTVGDGEGEHTVVCGAPNVAAGQKVIFARVGAVMDKLGFTIDRRKLRGVESAGMICSSSELGLDENHDGIAVLPASAEPGMPLSEHLSYDDVILGIGTTPNRGDALSHIGSARDIAAVKNTPLHRPQPPALEVPDAMDFEITIEAEELCPRYSAAILEGITVQDSPDWLATALTAVGIRPINNIVDVTNYVMMEIGQPMHAFDFRQLSGNRIVVRPSAPGEQFTTLDDEKHELPDQSLLICDGEKPVALAGVMGGQNSAVSDDTTTILLESAHFNASSVRRTAKLLQMSTDSSYRFERGSDPGITVWALQRAVELIQSTCGGTVRGVYDNVAKAIDKREVSLRPAFTNRILGINIPADEQKRILEALDIEVNDEGESWRCLVPTFRSDLEREIDLVEEVARIHGYDNIPVPGRIEMHVGDGFDASAFQNRLRQLLLGFGCDEVLSSSLVPRDHAAIGEMKDRVALVQNPVSKERPALRTGMLTSLLEAVDVNIRNGHPALRVFEIGSVFAKEGENSFSEKKMLGVAITGNAVARAWNEDERPSDFHDLKGILEELLSALYLDKESIFYYDRTSTLSDQVLTLEVKGRYAGQAVEVSDAILARFGIDQPVYYAEFEIAELEAALPDRQMYRPVPRYPSVTRDLAMVLSTSVQARQIEDVVRSVNPAHLRSMRIVDVFTHESLGTDKKSVAFTMSFQAEDHTLTDEEISTAVNAVVDAAKKELGAELRI